MISKRPQSAWEKEKQEINERNRSEQKKYEHVVGLWQQECGTGRMKRNHDEQKKFTNGILTNCTGIMSNMNRMLSSKIAKMAPNNSRYPEVVPEGF